MAISEIEARQVALDAANGACELVDDEVVIVDANTIKKAYGWIFFYQSKRFLEQGEASYCLAGNGPVVVMRDNGDVHWLPAAELPAEAIKRFEHEYGL